MGYKMLLASRIGEGKTIEADRLLADMILGAGPHVHCLLNGQTRAADLLRIKQVLDAGSHPAMPGQLQLREEPFARREMRARSVPWRARYRELRRRAETREAAGLDQDRVSTTGERRARSGAAREAVRLRSQGRCENPDCLLAVLPYRTAAGQPLLEIDHIDDHAQGGRDHPDAMIALCPNCHANKTRGAERSALRERLRGVAQKLDAAVLQQEQDGPRA